MSVTVLQRHICRCCFIKMSVTPQSSLAPYCRRMKREVYTLENQLQRGRWDGYTHRAEHTNVNTNKLSGNEPTCKVKSEVKDICYT